MILDSRHAPRKAALTVVEPVTDCFFEVSSLRSFSLYHFTLVAVNKYGRSGPVYTQEYTGSEQCAFGLNENVIGILHLFRTELCAFEPQGRPDYRFVCYSMLGFAGEEQRL